MQQIGHSIASRATRNMQYWGCILRVVLAAMVYPIHITPPLPACILYDCSGGWGCILHVALAAMVYPIHITPPLPACILYDCSGGWGCILHVALAAMLYPIHITPPFPACILYDCREGCGVIIGNTQSVSIPFLFLFFFHQSSLYPIKIFAKCFYLL